MLTIAQFLIQSIPVFISIAVPGFLLALALLRKTDLHLFEIFFVGIVLGISIPSLMGLCEFLIGISFSFNLHLINLLIMCLISIAVIVKDKIRVLPKSKLNPTSIYTLIAISIIIFLAWWIRIQAISPYFYEFDPYWYNTMAEYIINDGGVPLYADKAWWPQTYSFRGAIALVPYAEAGWYYTYSFFNGISSFDFNIMTLVSSLYPALAAALMCFFAYLWLSKEYGKAVGILAAGLLAVTPILIDKMLAGEFEMQPWGLFALVFFFAFYSLTLKTGSLRFALIASFAIMINFLGSAAGRLSIYTFIAISVVLLIIKFMKNEIDLKFIYTNLIIVAGIIISLILLNLYVLPLGMIVQVSVLAASVMFVLFMLLLYYLQLKISKSIEEKVLYLSSIFIVGLIVMAVTPAGKILSEFNDMFLGVVTYTDPTSQTIAEQTVAGSSLHESIGILGTDVSNFNFLGTNISDFSLVPVIIALAAIPLIVSLVGGLSIYALLGLVGVLPLSMTGLFKVKYTVYSGLFVPLMFCFGIGEICNRAGEYRKYVLALIAIVLFVQAMSYYDVVVSSIGIASGIDITSNAAISKVCNDKYADMKSTAANMSIFGINASIFGIQNFAVNAKSITQRVYCNRIPDHWLNAMFWLRDNAGVEERTFCWWDYGHWITTFGQRKSVTDNTHGFSLMHQEVADKIVYNTPRALAQYMREHKAEYLLLDQDLIAKWGALVYHACYYNNKTTMDIGPGGSDCDKDYSPEFIFIPNQITSDNLCSGSTQNNIILKVYSPYFLAKGTSKYYCISLNSLNEGLSLLQYGTQYVPLSLTYEDGKKVGITNGMFQGQNGDYLMFLVTYPSDSPDRKGKFYDSVFYKGFFEGEIPGFVQVHPDYKAQGPTIPVRIYKLVS